MSDTYRCAECGGIFEKGWTDDEALQEYEAIFSASEKATPAAVVCDDCYQKIMGGAQ